MSNTYYVVRLQSATIQYGLSWCMLWNGPMHAATAWSKRDLVYWPRAPIVALYRSGVRVWIWMEWCGVSGFVFCCDTMTMKKYQHIVCTPFLGWFKYILKRLACNTFKVHIIYTDGNHTYLFCHYIRWFCSYNSYYSEMYTTDEGVYSHNYVLRFWQGKNSVIYIYTEFAPNGIFPPDSRVGNWIRCLLHVT